MTPKNFKISRGSTVLQFYNKWRTIDVSALVAFPPPRRTGWALIQTPEINRHQLTYTRFLHGYSVNNINSTHGGFIVCNNNELGIITEFADHVGELANIRIIQRSIYFVENTEWSRFD